MSEQHQDQDWLTMILDKEAILKQEIAEYGFISAFAKSFVQHNIIKAEQNIANIVKAKEFNDTVVNLIDDNKRYRKIQAQNNKDLAILDNCILVLQRMKQAVEDHDSNHTAPSKKP